MSMKNKIIITGGAGFIGVHLTKLLYENNYEVFIIDKMSPQIHGLDWENSFLYKMVKDKANIFEEDICDSKSLENLIKKSDYIVHLAAETGTGQSMYEISNYVRTNSYGTAKVLENVVKNKNSIKKFILASSRAIYGEGKYICKEHGIVYPSARRKQELIDGYFDCKCPICAASVIEQPTDEGSDIKPNSIYGLTKYNQEQLTRTTCESINLPYSIFRFQNVYGKGQSLQNPYTGILAIFSRLILENKEINIFEDGFESRDFINVNDVASALMKDIESKTKDKTYNIGSGKKTTVLEIAKLLLKEFNSNVKLNVSGNFRLGDIRHNFADISNAKKYLKFRPKVELEDGIRELVDWIKNEKKSLGFTSYKQSMDEMKNLNLYYEKNES